MPSTHSELSMPNPEFNVYSKVWFSERESWHGCDSEVSAITEHMHSPHDQQLKCLSVKLVSIACTFSSSYLGG